MHAIEVLNLEKRFGNTKALDGLTFSVGKGEIYTLLGKNGAGKSTTLKILAGLLRPDNGCARILGRDVRDRKSVLERVGYIPEEPVLFPYLTAREVLMFSARMSGMDEWEDRVRYLLEVISFSPKVEVRSSNSMSWGTKPVTELRRMKVHYIPLLAIPAYLIAEFITLYLPSGLPDYFALYFAIPAVSFMDFLARQESSTFWLYRSSDVVSEFTKVTILKVVLGGYAVYLPSAAFVYPLVSDLIWIYVSTISLPFMSVICTVLALRDLSKPRGEAVTSVRSGKGDGGCCTLLLAVAGSRSYLCSDALCWVLLSPRDSAPATLHAHSEKDWQRGGCRVKAVVYRDKRKSTITFAIFLVGVFLASLAMVYAGLSEAAILAFFVVIYLALRVPLFVFAKSAESVEVDVIEEVETSPSAVFRAMIGNSKAFIICFSSLVAALILFVAIIPQYTFFPLNMLLILLVVSVFRNTRLKVCRQGIVDGGSALIPWSEFSGVRNVGGLIILERRFAFPVVLPERKDLLQTIGDLLGPKASG
ncbi:ABC transporter [Geoglobus ahangari]|uniref:ABC transporter n=1 Tax=Geoglobus ahangari TaxID=113653 RepID=A0A0F7IDC6_9EURY|nr:ABC transporter ATP-binding protein [Geoglobus ahangari]AKG90928.1 ABC transporter [Geoglobus ahangari]